VNWQSSWLLLDFLKDAQRETIELAARVRAKLKKTQQSAADNNSLLSAIYNAGYGWVRRDGMMIRYERH